ncbi:uncharacterized protein LOC135221128 [Macrobrachium nipponense]|uniref:uncharacterized protein LOC135221128 n=1 Tax=Macrobrachium nipponense TaxID=159736 RepID=UPI0030C87C7E
MPKKVAAIRIFHTTTTIKSLQEFFGIDHYYYCFLPNIATALAPFYKVLKGKPKALIWGLSQEATFTSSKNALAKATTLSFLVPGHSVLLSLDTSNVAIGDILEQIIHGFPRPLTFFSRKLSKTCKHHAGLQAPGGIPHCQTLPTIFGDHVFSPFKLTACH